MADQTEKDTATARALYMRFRNGRHGFIDAMARALASARSSEAEGGGR